MIRFSRIILPHRRGKLTLPYKGTLEGNLKLFTFWSKSTNDVVLDIRTDIFRHGQPSFLEYKIKYWSYAFEHGINPRNKSVLHVFRIQPRHKHALSRRVKHRLYQPDWLPSQPRRWRWGSFSTAGRIASWPPSCWIRGPKCPRGFSAVAAGSRLRPTLRTVVRPSIHFDLEHKSENRNLKVNHRSSTFCREKPREERKLFRRPKIEGFTGEHLPF